MSDTDMGALKMKENISIVKIVDIVSVGTKDNAPENLVLKESYGVGYCV